MIKDVVAEIRKNNKFLIACHINPDGDAVGSMLALALILKSLGKNVTCYSRDGVPEMFDFLPGAEDVKNDIGALSNYDVTIAVDCGSLNQLGEDFLKIENKGLFINIDHHETNDRFADICLIEKTACSTGDIIYDLSKELDTLLNIDMAYCIYTTIVVDTGSFRYESANTKAFETASKMVAMGVNPWKVAEKIYESHPIGRIKLLSEVLNTLRLDGGGRISSMVVTKDMMAKTNTLPEHTDGFVNYGRGIKGVEVAILIREIGENKYKASFRSKGKVNVAKISKSFNGGGHHNAGGCMLTGTEDEVRGRLISAALQKIQECGCLAGHSS